MSFRHSLVLLVLLAFGLVACKPVNPPQTVVVVPSAVIVETATSSGSPVPAFTGMPPQTNAAALHPPERREELSRLSNLLQFKVTGWNGAQLGKIADFIINTCETYIIYFKVEPSPDLKLASGSQLVIPFEIVTINSGVLDAEAKSIALYLTPQQVAAAPVFSDPLPLFPSTWEETVRAYWLQVARVSHLTSECKAGGSNSANAVHKIAYASQLFGAELKDGNHISLGTVAEAILEPESGKLGYYVIDLSNNGGLVMIPLSKTNIPEDVLKAESTVELVLLSETNLLLNAPRLASVEQAANAQTQNAARQYWGQ
jgi:sporulation protein YlmC with PRC-barrel domain